MEFKPFKQGKYVLLERLASGGMAEVYRAKADGAGGFVKQLAVKRILPNYSGNDEFQKMFEYEARLSSQLTHANIVQIYDFIQSGDVYLLAMEFVDGKNLRQFINKAKKMNLAIPLPFSIYVINEASKGLDYAHKKKDDLTGRPLNIIHRDMSPQNIMCAYEGAIKIVDFGIAKAKDKVDETRSGVIKGKFGYMSPEQANGANINPRSDIFSTVIILWEMATGRRLFTAENDLATLKMIQDCVITPPSKINPNVKPDLERIIMKGLAKDISLRYAEASVISRDLQAYLARYYPTFTQKDASDVLSKVFKEEITIEKKRWEEALKKSITFSQGGDSDNRPSLEGVDGDETISETGSDTAVTGAHANKPEEKGDATVVSQVPSKQHTLMDFDASNSLDPSMLTIDEPSASEAAGTPMFPPTPSQKSPQSNERDEDRTLVSEDELVTPSPFNISLTNQPTKKGVEAKPPQIATGSNSKANSVDDPDIIFPGQQSKGSGFSSANITDLKLRDQTKAHPYPTHHDGRGHRSAQNPYLDDRFEVPKRSMASVYGAAAALVAVLGGAVYVYQMGGVPALIQRLSERGPAEGTPKVTAKVNNGSNYKAPTATEDENAKNENQCIINVTSDPPGATVSVDRGNTQQAKTQTTPATFELPCGQDKNFTIEYPGYQPISENIVPKKRTKDKYWTLKKIPQGIVRLIISQNANITVDGHPLKYLPAGEPFPIVLRAGFKHKFKFENQVLGILQEREIEVEDGITQEVQIKLEEQVKRK